MADDKLANEDSAFDKLGRTIADLLHDGLLHPFRGLLMLVGFASLLGIVLTACWLFTKLYRLTPSEIKLWGDDPHVLLKSEDAKSSEYVVMVSPQGWQTTGVNVKSGDRITLRAGGKITIDITSIMKVAALRQEYEERWAKELNIRRDDPTEARVPEDYFTSSERQSLVLDRPWVGPEGFDLATFKPSFRARRNRYLLPDKPAGGLIAAISADDSPARSDATFVGRGMDLTAQHDGPLWLTINDVQNPDSTNPKLFYIDNVGSFWVTIKVAKQ